MTDYKKQAQDFLDATGTQIFVKHSRTGKYFDEDKQERDIWDIKIARGNREYVFTFGSSIAEREKWDKEPYTLSDGTKRRMPEAHNTLLSIEKVQESKRKLEKDYRPAGTGHRPTAYDILACLTKYSPGNSVDDFATEFGYEKPSEALATFQAVQKEWEMIQKLFSDKEIETLQEIS